MIIPSKSESIYGWKNFLKKIPPLYEFDFVNTITSPITPFIVPPGTHSLSYTRLHEPSITGIRDKIQVTSPKFLTWIHAKMFHPIPPLSDTDPRWSRVAKPVHSFPATCSSVPAQIPRGHFYSWPLTVRRRVVTSVHKKMNAFVTFFFKKWRTSFWYSKWLVFLL